MPANKKLYVALPLANRATYKTELTRFKYAQKSGEDWVLESTHWKGRSLGKGYEFILNSDMLCMLLKVLYDACNATCCKV